MSKLRIKPCLDSIELAERRRRELAIRPELAESLGRSAVEAIELGYYLTDRGKVDWNVWVQSARKAKVSIQPDADLPQVDALEFAEAVVQVTNETTLGAARRMVDNGKRPLALNFANGIETGGGLLRGATAQEEALCRSSALYATLVDDPMYEFHRDNKWDEASDWSILSPNVPVFRDELGMELDAPGCSASLRAQLPTHLRLDSRELAICYRNAFGECYRLRELTVSRNSFSVRGAAERLRTIQNELQSTFVMP